MNPSVLFILLISTYHTTFGFYGNVHHGLSNIYYRSLHRLNINSNIDDPNYSLVHPDELTSHDASFITIRTPESLPTNDHHNQTHSFTNNAGTVNSLSGSQFGSIFTQSAPYIAQHRSTIMILHLPSKLFHKYNRDIFDKIMDDISILHLLGIQLVVVAGVREQLEERIRRNGNMTIVYSDGMRVTDDETMAILKDISGSVRIEVESSLGRGFRGSANTRGINVISGNYFYSAKPVGVRNGVDFKLTGEVRRIETENCKKRLESGDVVLLTSLGHSHSGEVFNVPSELLAAECAAKLGASKIIFLTDGQSMWDKRTGQIIQSLRHTQAIKLLESLGFNGAASSPVEVETESSQPPPQQQQPQQPQQLFDQSSIRGIDEPPLLPLPISPLSDTNNSYDTTTTTTTTVVNAITPVGGMVENDLKLSTCPTFIHLIARCVHALSGGVRRAHLVPTTQGALLKELFTRDGAGILISRDVYEGIRQAGPADVRAVEEIIRPLELDGILVPRSREQLENEMSHCYLLTRDGTTLACAMIKKYGDKHAEISCLAVNQLYRRAGRGETLLNYLERRALLIGVEYVFVLSTRTMQWFEERGFELCDPALLPPSRKYNKERGSKVYMKKLGSQRDLDAEELLWNV